jgi:hypothetical protein
MSQGSSLVSVVGSTPEELNKWASRLVDDDEELARLHVKFWGKSMADEEREWRKQQSSGSENKGEIQNNVGRDEAIDAIGDESIDEDSDIIPGCGVFDLGMTGMSNSGPFWIRVWHLLAPINFSLILLTGGIRPYF